MVGKNVPTIYLIIKIILIEPLYQTRITKNLKDTYESVIEMTYFRTKFHTCYFQFKGKFYDLKLFGLVFDI